MCLPSLISLNQTAFVQERKIVDKVMLAQEIIRGCHRNDMVACCPMKIDLKKALDFVKWKFLFNILLAMSFPRSFLSWLQACITSPSL